MSFRSSLALTTCALSEVLASIDWATPSSPHSRSPLPPLGAYFAVSEEFEAGERDELRRDFYRGRRSQALALGYLPLPLSGLKTNSVWGFQEPPCPAREIRDMISWVRRRLKDARSSGWSIVPIRFHRGSEVNLYHPGGKGGLHPFLE
jgi:hypothetical protein